MVNFKNKRNFVYNQIIDLHIYVIYFKWNHLMIFLYCTSNFLTLMPIFGNFKFYQFLTYNFFNLSMKYLPHSHFFNKEIEKGKKKEIKRETGCNITIGTVRKREKAKLARACSTSCRYNSQDCIRNPIKRYDSEG